MQDWSKNALYSLNVIKNIKLSQKINLNTSYVFNPKKNIDFFGSSLTLRSRNVWYRLIFRDLHLVLYNILLV